MFIIILGFYAPSFYIFKIKQKEHIYDNRYSDWRLRGSASVGENNQVTVTIPVRTDERKRRRGSDRD